MMNLTTKELGYMATQYERYGQITEDEIMDAFIDEELDESELINNLSDYNEYLINNGYEPYYSMDELDDLLYGMNPLEIIQMSYFGKFNFCDDYIQFNGYGNLDSFSEYQITKEIKEDRDFLKWYITENNLIDAEDMQDAIEYGNKYLSMGY